MINLVLINIDLLSNAMCHEAEPPVVSSTLVGHVTATLSTSRSPVESSRAVVTFNDTAPRPAAGQSCAAATQQHRIIYQSIADAAAAAAATAAGGIAARSRMLSRHRPSLSKPNNTCVT